MPSTPVFFEPSAAASDKARAGSTELVKKVSEIFEAMHKDGTLTKLSMKWYGFDVTRKRPAPKPSKPVQNRWAACFIAVLTYQSP